MRPVTTEEDYQAYLRNMGKGGLVGPGKGGVSHATTSKRELRSQVGNLAPSPTFLYQFSLTGQMISGKNRVRIRRDGHHYPEKQFINWRAKAQIELLEQRRPLEPIAVPVSLRCWYWPSDRRTRDVTGMEDALFFMLVYAKILKNDGLIFDCSWKRYPHTKYPKLVMEIEAWG